MNRSGPRALGARIALLTLVLGACAPPPGTEPPAPANSPADSTDAADSDAGEEDGTNGRPAPTGPRDPAAPPRVAMLAGLMPVANIGADQFLADNPAADGRGVLIGILDSGVDLGLPGFQTTTTGQPKVVDARDFSGEGRIELSPVAPSSDGSVTVGGHRLAGFGHVMGYAVEPYYGGVLHELPLGEPDVNGNGSLEDEFPVVVVRTSSGWAVVADGDGDGSLLDEVPVHDYLVAAETFTFSDDDGAHNRGPMTIAVNVEEVDGRPVVDLFFDNGSHGSHVGGIAAGHTLFGEEGFDGLAPGAQIVAAKIANNARGGITVTGSMLRAMNYTADFAQQRGLPLIINMSFGVGNETEGAAAIDSLVAEFALKHPDVLVVISAGNDGPGISTVGFPGSADHILSVCALFPGVFSGGRPQGFAVDADGIADFSARGGELAKPDLCAPGIAFSNVPPWNRGDEIAGGTSMAAPQIAGAAALLQSARVQDGAPARAVDLKQALLASARGARGGNAVDMGSGVPRLPGAYGWLEAGHQAGLYVVRALPDGGNTSQRDAAYRRSGLSSPADTVQRFEIRSVAGQPAARFLLRSDQPWLRTPRALELSGSPATVELRYVASRLRTPGLYVGSVRATPASDTLAGPAFRLTNTVIVPHPLEQPFVEGRDLGPGRVRRYFFDVPATAGGLTVELELRYRTQRGSLYLFEPNGQPFRGGSSEDAGGGSGPKVRIAVPGEDLVPGVYEAVVVAPPTSALSFELRAALPRYAVEEIASGPSAMVRMRADAPEFIEDASVFQREGEEYPTVADSVAITAREIGAAMTRQIVGRGSAPVTIPVRVPDWAGELTVDVALPRGAWNLYTDMGVTVFDSAGAKEAEGPLSYRVGRLTEDLPRRLRGKLITIELFPAFAHLEPPASWEAEVTVGFIARAPKALEPMGVDTATVLSMGPGEAVGIQFAQPAEALEIPEGFTPLYEVTANPAGGAPSTRRRAVER